MKVNNCSADYSIYTQKLAKNNFKGVATYAPRCYREVRDLANAVYENSKGSQKVLMKLYKLRGENLNNIITAVGTSAVAPFFIRYNPFSREDKNSKAYSAWRQPISAGITLGGQLLVMSNYNKMLDRHAVFAGVDEMDLRAKPPASVLKPIATAEYPRYKSECILNGVDPLPKKKWVANRIESLQDEAYYKELRRLRESMDISKVPMIELVKPSQVNAQKEAVFKTVLKEKYAFSDEELAIFKDYNHFSKSGKKLVSAKHFDMAHVQDSIHSFAESQAIKEIEQSIKFESQVKFNTSNLFKQMNDELSLKKLEIMKKYTGSADGIKSPSVLQKIEAEIESVSKSIYDKFINDLKVKYDAIMQKAEEARTMEERALEFAYKKVIKQGGIKNIKFHGKTLEDVERSVKIKKWLINRINLSETKLKVWKDKSGMVVGLLILPITCTILNWAYPKIMKKLFPRLSEVKEAKKARDRAARKAELAEENNAKEAK